MTYMLTRGFNLRRPHTYKSDSEFFPADPRHDLIGFGNPAQDAREFFEHIVPDVMTVLIIYIAKIINVANCELS